MELINRMRKNRKGFTLVEIIVVLVILAILAAFTIPTMLGFVNDARGKAYIAEARTVYVAAQSTATEFSATNALTDAQLQTALGSAVVLANPAVVPNAAAGGDAAAKASVQMRKYLGTDLGIVASGDQPATAPTWTVSVGASGTSTAQVKTVAYTKGGYTVTISGNSATVVKNQ